MNKLQIGLLLTLCAGFLATPSPLYAAEKISVFTERFYPLSYKSNEADNSKVVGFATNLVLAVLAQSGYEYELSLVPWARAIQSIDNNANVMVYSMARTVNRESQYHWIGEIWPIKQYLYGLRSKKNTLPDTLNKAQHARIGVVRGSVVHSYLARQDFDQLMEVNNSKRNLF